MNAQNYEPKYEVDANKAEYYIGKFNDYKDVDDLTAKIQLLINSPEKLKVMSECARSRVENFFSLQQEVDNIISVYESCWKSE